MKICVLGAGAWGTALAIAFARAGEVRPHEVCLWARDQGFVASMAGSRMNSKYLPGVALPDGIRVEANLFAALRDCEILIIATPVVALREILRRVKESGFSGPMISVCKGFEPETARFPHEVVAEEWGGKNPNAVLSGPSFAMEVARGQPTALTLASFDAEFARRTAEALHQATLRIYYTDDVPGVEIGGAVKNVMAIATGICDGMALGLNARAALITRGLAEISRFGASLGGRPETFMGLAGAGDLILTCTGDLSRNRTVGRRLAQGEKLEAILRDLGHVAEGVNCARETRRLAELHHVEMPITRAVCDVLFDGKAPRQALQELLSRDPKLES